eukprot:TRINITY_DN13968_c0_g1_i1.p1 TRINITY_DN13968_c0_g1~~TRINITY_DN13968_c0_g1_i1.p1  ORF type:complete len:362 (-),score=48.04 TRINITY_DN13968_c0_g1_i1:184-1233(-)
MSISSSIPDHLVETLNPFPSEISFTFDETDPCVFSYIPSDIITTIALMLHPSTVIQLARVSKTFFLQFSSENLWKKVISHFWGNQFPFQQKHYFSEISRSIQGRTPSCIPLEMVHCSTPAWGSEYGPENLLSSTGTFCSASGYHANVNFIFKVPQTDDGCVFFVSHVSLRSPGWGYTRPIRDAVVYLSPDMISIEEKVDSDDLELDEYQTIVENGLYQCKGKNWNEYKNNLAPLNCGGDHDVRMGLVNDSKGEYSNDDKHSSRVQSGKNLSENSPKSLCILPDAYIRCKSRGLGQVHLTEPVVTRFIHLKLIRPYNNEYPENIDSQCFQALGYCFRLPSFSHGGEVSHK